MSGACLESMASSKPTVLHQAVAAGLPQPSPQFTHQSRRSPPNVGLSNVLVSASASLDEKQSATTAIVTQTSLRIRNLRFLGPTLRLNLSPRQMFSMAKVAVGRFLGINRFNQIINPLRLKGLAVNQNLADITIERSHGAFPAIGNHYRVTHPAPVVRRRRCCGRYRSRCGDRCCNVNCRQK